MSFIKFQCNDIFLFKKKKNFFKMSKKIVIETNLGIPPPPPPPPAFTQRSRAIGLIPPPPQTAPPTDSLKTVTRKVATISPPPPPPPPIQSTKLGLSKKIQKNEEITTNPLEKLFSDVGKTIELPSFVQEQVDDAHKFNEIFGNLILDSNPLNSISNFLEDDDDEKSLSNKKATSSLLSLQLPPPVEQPTEVIISTSATLSFTPSVSINFSRSSYTTLQSCIDQAPAKAYIKIQAGIYPERLIINKEVVLDGSGEVSICGADISSNCSISKVTFRCDNKGQGGDVIITKNAIVSFQNVSFLTNETNALAVKENSIAHIIDCNITSLALPCLFANSSSSISASNTIFDGSQSYGILMADQSTLFLEKCTCRRNQKAAICTNQTASVSLESTRVELNTDGIECNGTGQVNLTNSYVINNSNLGIIIKDRCFVTARNCQFISNLNGSVNSSNSGIFFSFDSTFKDASTHPIIFISENSALSSSGDSFFGRCLSAVAASDNSDVYIENGKIEVFGSGCIGAKSTIGLKSVNFNASNIGLQLVECDIDLKTVGVTSRGVSCSLQGCTGTISDSGIQSNANGIELELSDIKILKTGFKCKSNAIYITNGKPFFEQCVFEGNDIAAAVVDGQPVFKLCAFNMNNHHASVTGGTCVFDACKLFSSIQKGIVVNNGQCAVSQCEISTNNGAIITDNAKLFVDRSIFTGNQENAIYIANNTTVNIGLCNFTNHKNTIVCDKSLIGITGCNFIVAEESHILSIASQIKLESSTLQSAKTIGFNIREGSNIILNKCIIIQCGQALMLAQESTLECNDVQVQTCQSGFHIEGKAKASNVQFMQTGSTLTITNGGQLSF